MQRWHNVQEKAILVASVSDHFGCIGVSLGIITSTIIESDAAKRRLQLHLLAFVNVFCVQCVCAISNKATCIFYDIVITMKS